MKNHRKPSLRMSMAAVVLLMGLGATVYATPVLVAGVNFEATGYSTHQWMQGSDEKDISAASIPPAVWLFGSGLMGLMVITRRENSGRYKNFR